MKPWGIPSAIGVVLFMSACVPSSPPDPSVGQSSPPVVSANPTTTAPATPFETYSVGDNLYIRTDCPAADPILRGGADGLPREGQTARERVATLVANHRSSLLASFNAVEVVIVPRNGQVWTGPGNGEYRIVDAEDYQIELIIAAEVDCPDAPYFWNGIPVLFTRHAPTIPPPSEPVVSALDVGETVPLRVLAIRPNNPSLAVLDLEAGTTTVYPPGAHALPLDATDGAVMTPDRDLIVWTQGVARLFSGSLDHVDVELGPSPPRSIPSYAPALRAVPTLRTDQVWLVQPGIGWGDNDYPTLVELVPLGGGEAVLRIELDPAAFPVAATEAGLIFNTHEWLDTGDGFEVEPGSESALHLAADGTTSRIGPGSAFASSSTRVARLVCPADRPTCDTNLDANILVLSDTDGGHQVEVPADGDGTWANVGGPMIPSDAMPFQTVSPDGSELLVRSGQALDVNGVPSQSVLVAVDLADGTLRPIGEFDDETPLAAWSADGQWIALFWQDDIYLVNAESPDTTLMFTGVIPSDHFPLAAG